MSRLRGGPRLIVVTGVALAALLFLVSSATAQASPAAAGIGGRTPITSYAANASGRSQGLFELPPNVELGRGAFQVWSTARSSGGSLPGSYANAVSVIGFEGLAFKVPANGRYNGSVTWNISLRAWLEARSPDAGVDAVVAVFVYTYFTDLTNGSILSGPHTGAVAMFAAIRSGTSQISLVGGLDTSWVNASLVRGHLYRFESVTLDTSSVIETAPGGQGFAELDIGVGNAGAHVQSWSVTGPS